VQKIIENPTPRTKLPPLKRKYVHALIVWVYILGEKDRSQKLTCTIRTLLNSLGKEEGSIK
jgi:hypothetical protein